MTMFAAPRLLAAFLLVTVLGCSTTPPAGPDAPIAEVAEAATARTHAASVAAKPSCPFVRRVFRPGKETAYRFLTDEAPLTDLIDFVCTEFDPRPDCRLSEQEICGFCGDVSFLRQNGPAARDSLLRSIQLALPYRSAVWFVVDLESQVAFVDANRRMESHACCRDGCKQFRSNPFEGIRQARGLKPLGPVNLD